MTIPKKAPISLLQSTKKVLSSLGIFAAGTSVFSLFYLLANWLVLTFQLSFPVGLVGCIGCLLFFILVKRIPNFMVRASKPLLGHMSLFFVPAVIAIVEFKSSLAEHWIAMLLAIFVATLLAFLITLLIAKYTIGNAGR